jgi:thymidylate synthase
MQQYLGFLQHILAKGRKRQDRTGVGTHSVFSYEMRFDLQAGFPLVTTKKIHMKSVIHELLWFIKGDTNVKYLNDNGVRIWDAWQDENGDLGPIYGKQWRSWQDKNGKLHDQLANVIEMIKTDPHSRRLIVNAWNVGELENMALPPCHNMFQFYVNDGKLSCKLTQRSADAFLGVPFNIASYSLLTHMIASVCDLQVGDFIWSGGDCHIYNNHLEQVEEQLGRTPFPLPQLELNPRNSIDDFIFDDFCIKDYRAHPTIKAPIAV